MKTTVTGPKNRLVLQMNSLPKWRLFDKRFGPNYTHTQQLLQNSLARRMIRDGIDSLRCELHPAPHAAVSGTFEKEQLSANHARWLAVIWITHSFPNPRHHYALHVRLVAELWPLVERRIGAERMFWNRFLSVAFAIAPDRQSGQSSNPTWLPFR